MHSFVVREELFGRNLETTIELLTRPDSTSPSVGSNEEQTQKMSRHTQNLLGERLCDKTILTYVRARLSIDQLHCDANN
ncbi:MAG: hypothetical protein REI95_01795 [Oxalicibacterium faecigallinarum]|nr:hypothetical protein [Oxalicibacterium faecigallinarum]